MPSEKRKGSRAWVWMICQAIVGLLGGLLTGAGSSGEQIGSLESFNTALLREVEELGAQVDTLTTEVGELAEERDEVAAALEAAVDEKEGLQAEVDDRSGELDEREIALDAGSEELDTREGALDTREEQLDAYDVELTAFADDLDARETAVADAEGRRRRAPAGPPARPRTAMSTTPTALPLERPVQPRCTRVSLATAPSWTVTVTGSAASSTCRRSRCAWLRRGRRRQLAPRQNETF